MQISEIHFTTAEIVQISIGLGQLYLGFLALNKPHERKEKVKEQPNYQKITLWNSIESFDFFAFFIAAGCLLLAATITLPSFSEWIQRLASFTLLSMSTSVFTLTVSRVHTNKLGKQMNQILLDAKIDSLDAKIDFLDA